MGNETILASVAVSLKYIVLFLIPFVEPQLAGILGAIAYLIVRHELNMAELSLKSFVIVMFFGWLGAWATVHIFEGYPDIDHVWVSISSATVGFLSYDAMLIFGANTTSTVGFFTEMIKITIKKGVNKWL